MAAIDPTTVRLSNNFLLSDFMGCDSVYRHGYSNAISDNRADQAKLLQGRNLAKALDTVVDMYGPISVTYGYISPSLSRKIVRYQDPDKPSYHRWDLGAAADICVHDWVQGELWEYASPISLVYDICSISLPFDRIITYSESDILCLALSTLHEPMNKVYENRYTGEARPKFIKYPTTNDGIRGSMLMEAQEAVEATWKGRGYPSYHGGGRKQYEHHRLNQYTLLSDFLYSPLKVHKGIPNPPPTGDTALQIIRNAADFHSEICLSHRPHGKRPSIVAAIDCNERPWTERFVIDYVPALDFLDNFDMVRRMFHAAASRPDRHVDEVKVIRMKKGETRIRVIGSRV
jgi:hypothetical protein